MPGPIMPPTNRVVNELRIDLAVYLNDARWPKDPLPTRPVRGATLVSQMVDRRKRVQTL